MAFTMAGQISRKMRTTTSYGGVKIRFSVNTRACGAHRADRANRAPQVSTGRYPSTGRYLCRYLCRYLHSLLGVYGQDLLATVDPGLKLPLDVDLT